MIVVNSEAWSTCSGVFGGHPAFILGNGPTLPPKEDLGVLDDFFTVGVNRIWYSGYDPLVVQWTDSEIAADVQNPDFEKKWLAARNERALRDIILLGVRKRE